MAAAQGGHTEACKILLGVCKAGQGGQGGQGRGKGSEDAALTPFERRLEGLDVDPDVADRNGSGGGGGGGGASGNDSGIFQGVEHPPRLYADVNAFSSNGWTALMEACSAGAANTITLLLDSGASTSPIDSDGRVAADHLPPAARASMDQALMARLAPPPDAELPIRGHAYIIGCPGKVDPTRAASVPCAIGSTDGLKQFLSSGNVILENELVDAEIERSTVLARLRKFFANMSQRWGVKLVFFRGTGNPATGDWVVDEGGSVSLRDVCELWIASPAGTETSIPPAFRLKSREEARWVPLHTLSR